MPSAHQAKIGSKAGLCMPHPGGDDEADPCRGEGRPGQDAISAEDAAVHHHGGGDSGVLGENTIR